MNAHCHKLVFSKRLGQLIAVGEHTCSQSRATGASRARPLMRQSLHGAGPFIGLLSWLCAGMMTAWAEPAPTALPSGGTVAAGSANISTSGTAMTIRQGTERAIVNWQSFNIGKDASVSIMQPGSQSVLLNRVTGESPSQIFGHLSANGQIVLVNPNGMTLGKAGSVSAASFTASSLGISDADFMAGNMRFERNGSIGAILNQGRLAANGGYVALLGASVTNEGRIETRGGAALLGAAEAIHIPLSSSGRVKLELSPAQINASVANTKDGVIVTEGGQVYMQAAAVNKVMASVLQSGSIDTTAAQGGAVHLLADGGQIRVDGVITANSTGRDINGQPRKGGDIVVGRDEETGTLSHHTDVSGASLQSERGFIETSGDVLKADGVNVQAADWLLDPYNITITSSTSGTTYSDPNSGGSYTYAPSATSSILATDIQNSLNNGTNVKISTGLSGSAGSDAGNITVATDITKSSGTAATLTLEAHRKITFNSGIKITDADATGKLGVNLDANGVGGTSSDGNSLSLLGNSAIDVGGDVNVNVSNQSGGSTLNSAIVLRLGDMNQAGTGSRTLIRGANVNIGMSLSGTNTSGLFAEHATGIEATTGNINISATFTGAGTTGGAAVTMGSGWNTSYFPAAEYLRALNGSIDVVSTVSGTGANGIFAFSGTEIKARDNINLRANVSDATKTAFSIGREFNNARIQSTAGDVLVQSNQGAITAGSSLQSTAFSGRNITIDNTGGTVNASTGAITAGNGSASAASTHGINLGPAAVSTVLLNATGNINIAGASLNGAGVNIAAALTGAAITVTGRADGSNTGVFSGGALTANSASVGDVNITGNSSTGGGVTLQGTVTAKNNVNISGTSSSTSSSNQGVVVQNTVTATTGDISVTGDTNSSIQRAVAITANGTTSYGALVTSAASSNINISADTLFIHPNSSVNAGASGTVTIKTTTSGNSLALGTADTLSSTAASRLLALDQSELDKITAGKLVLGDSNTGGNINVTGAVTTADTTGNIALLSNGSVAINAAFQAGAAAGKNLSINMAGSGSATQSASLKANALELLGSNASYTLNDQSNNVGTLAANAKAISYTDTNALTIGSVNGTSGVTATGAVSVATQSGDLTLTNAISTSNTASSAILLNAGVSTN